jgi:hypothetical protein
LERNYISGYANKKGSLPQVYTTAKVGDSILLIVRGCVGDFCIELEPKIRNRWKSFLELIKGSRDSDGLRAGWPGFNSRHCKIFLFSTASRPTLEPSQPPIEWATGLFLWGESGRGLKPTTYVHLVAKSRMVEVYLQSPICLHGILLN